MADSDPSPPSDPEPWYRSAFGADYLERYAHRDLAAAQADLPFLVETLSRYCGSGARILDLCCGAGRYLSGLSGAGFRLAGFDLSQDLLRVARRQSPAAVLVRAEMQALPFAAARFDAGVSLFTSFGYLRSEAEDLGALREAARVLRPGGIFILDFFNRVVVLRELAPSSTQRLGSRRICESRRYEPASGRLEKRIRIEPDGGGPVRELLESVRAYSAGELEGLLQAAGLQLLERHGSLRGEPFEEARSPRCVLTARKAQGMMEGSLKG